MHVIQKNHRCCRGILTTTLEEFFVVISVCDEIMRGKAVKYQMDIIYQICIKRDNCLKSRPVKYLFICNQKK